MRNKYKEPVKLKFGRHHSLMEDTKYKKSAKGWRPTKRFWIQSTINIETGTVKDGFVVAKDKEQDDEWEKAVLKQVEFFWKSVWGDKFDWFVKNTKYLVDKHGEKEFAKQWNKAMKN